MSQPRSCERRSERVPLVAEVALRRSGKLNFRTSVYDLSPHGCRIQFVERPNLEELVWIKFDGLEALQAQAAGSTASQPASRSARRSTLRYLISSSRG